jgi:hypothetical protein
MRNLGILMIALAFAACGGTADTTDTTAGNGETTTTVVDETTPTTDDEAATTTAPLSTSEPSLGSPIEVGAVVQVGSWRLRVSGVIPDATGQVMAENEFNEPPGEGNQFFMASVEATYTGTDSSTFWLDMTLKAVGEASVAYEPFDATCGVIPEDLNDTGETFPGGTVTGNVCWNVESSDATSLVMVAEETFSFEETRAFLSLDPAAEPVDETTVVEGIGADLGPTIAAGVSATVGAWEITVIAVTPDATDQVLADNQFNEPPREGSQYFIAELEATYVGSDSSTFWIDMSVGAVGESRVVYEPFGASCGLVPSDINDAGETFPGGTITGNVCWTIRSSDAPTLVMIAEESFTFEGTRVFFALTEQTPAFCPSPPLPSVRSSVVDQERTMDDNATYPLNRLGG